MWKRRPISCSAWKFCPNSSFVTEPCPGAAACCCAEADDSARTAAALAASAMDEMPDFVAISLSNRVPGRTLSVSAIEPLSKFRRADHSNVTALRPQTAKLTFCSGVQNRIAVADIAVKYSETTARSPPTAMPLTASGPSRIDPLGLQRNRGQKRRGSSPAMTSSGLERTVQNHSTPSTICSDTPIGDPQAGRRLAGLAEYVDLGAATRGP